MEGTWDGDGVAAVQAVTRVKEKRKVFDFSKVEEANFVAEGGGQTAGRAGE